MMFGIISTMMLGIPMGLVFREKVMFEAIMMVFIAFRMTFT
jgi:hypothetical protein